MAISNYNAPQQTPAEELGGGRYNNFLNKLFDFKTESDYPYNKRIFITLCQPLTGSSGQHYDPPGYSGSLFIKPLRTSLTGSFNPSGPYKTNNLAELSTFEVVGKSEVEPIGESGNRLALIPSDKFDLNQQYVNKVHSGLGSHKPEFDNFISGSYLLSLCTDDNPSLLIELNKEQQLPGGIGDKEFIIIPEDLHPFIKDNLLYFLSQAGVNVGGDTSALIKINATNKTLF